MKELIYIIAILLSAILGDVIVRPVIDKLNRYIGHKPDFPYISTILGIVERLIYTSSFLIGYPQFIAIWFSLKMAGGWGAWKDPNQMGRARYTLSLVGGGLSILVSVAVAIIAIRIVNFLMI